MENVKWLEHLEEAVPTEGYGNRLSMYLIALEAWRRGITVNFFTVDNPENKLLIRYSLKLNDKEHKFVSSRGDKLTDEAFEICDNKDLTKQYLKEAGVKVPEGKRFNHAREMHQSIIDYGAFLGFPLVLKPVSENAGKGVFSNINSVEELTDTVNYLCEELNYTDLIVEEYIPGTEYRVLTVGDKIAAAVNRIPANIIGDGVNTIKDLIIEKNKMKKDNPNLSKKTIQIDKEVMDAIEKLGYTLDSIPGKGEQIFLRTKSNISTGGDPIDVTDQLTEEQVKVIKKTIKAIPGLTTSGMDLMIDPDDQSATVIEVNTKPMLGLHVFPMEGEARDVVKDIVDYYFPETVNGNRSNLYFDFENVISPLDNLSVKTVKLTPPCSLAKVNGKKVIIHGEGLTAEYRNQIRLFVLKSELHGYIKKIDNNSVELVLGSTNKVILDEFIASLETQVSNVTIHIISKETWDKPLNIGFKIKHKTRSELKDLIKAESVINDNLQYKLERLIQKNKDLKAKNKEMKQETRKLINDIDKRKEKYKKIKKQKRLLSDKINELEREKALIEEELYNIKHSRSWKVTRPLRQVTGKLKK